MHDPVRMHLKERVRETEGDCTRILYSDEKTRCNLIHGWQQTTADSAGDI